MLDKVSLRTDLRASTNYDEMISQPQAIRYIAEFMHQTGLLGQFQHVELVPEPDPEPIGLAAME